MWLLFTCIRYCIFINSVSHLSFFKRDGNINMLLRLEVKYKVVYDNFEYQMGEAADKESNKFGK